jgi:hypothetical protein
MATEFDTLDSGPPSAAHRAASDVLWGIGWGSAFAAAFSLFVGGQALLDGGLAARAHGMSVGRVIAAYWVVGVGAGAVLGLLRPMLPRVLGRALVGWVCGAVVYRGIGVARDGWTAETPRMATVLGLLVGVPAALILGRRTPTDDASSQASDRPPAS